MAIFLRMILAFLGVLLMLAAAVLAAVVLGVVWVVAQVRARS